MELVYWAGAKAAAGTSAETWPASSIGAALRAAAERRADPRFDRLLSVCTVLIDGVVVRADQLDTPLSGSVRAEILPPYAGGSG